jgi:integrase
MTGSIKRRSEGSYQIAVYLGFDANGKQQYHRETVRGTKKDAQTRLADLLHSLHRGTKISTAKTTLAEYLDDWLKTHAKPNVSPKTYERYAEIVRLTIQPHIGHILLDRIQPIQIQSFYALLLESGRRKKLKSGKTGLSAQTVLHVHRLLNEALRCAVKWRLLLWSPCDAVQPPRVEAREMRTLSEAESAWLLVAAATTRFYPAFLIASATGLRRGEALAVRWRDIALDTGMLTVNQAIEKTHDGIRFKPPKTRRSRRPIPLPAFAVRGLKDFQQKQARERDLFESSYADHDLVCAAPDGSPLDPDLFSSEVIRFLKTIGLAGLSFHKLRHSHATQLLSQNVHPKVVQERLGHSSIA